LPVLIQSDILLAALILITIKCISDYIMATCQCPHNWSAEWLCYICIKYIAEAFIH